MSPQVPWPNVRVPVDKTVTDKSTFLMQVAHIRCPAVLRPDFSGITDVSFCDMIAHLL